MDMIPGFVFCQYDGMGVCANIMTFPFSIHVRDMLAR